METSVLKCFLFSFQLGEVIGKAPKFLFTSPCPPPSPPSFGEAIAYTVRLLHHLREVGERRNKMGNVPTFHEMAPLSLAVWYMLSHRLQYLLGEAQKRGCHKRSWSQARHRYNRRVITPFSSKREIHHLASS